MRSVAIDIGNTRIKSALFDKGQLVECAYFHHMNLKALADWLLRVSPSRFIISSTAEKSISIDHLLPSNAYVLHLNCNTPLSIKNDYQAETLGQDRMANAVAGYLFNKKASLVIDLGTCITYDWTVKGVYLGGSISPGLHMRLKSMNEFTGRLPLVEDITQGEIIGKNTEESLLSGVLFGIQYELSGIISVFEERFPGGSVLFTGGDSLFFADTIENHIFADPFLTLKGLEGILEFNNA